MSPMAIAGCYVRRITVLCLWFGLTGTFIWAQKAASDSPHSVVNAIADDYFAALLALTPEFGTLQGIKGAHHDRITDNSLEGIHRAQAQFDALSQRLSGIDAAAL